MSRSISHWRSYRWRAMKRTEKKKKRASKKKKKSVAFVHGETASHRLYRPERRTKAAARHRSRKRVQPKYGFHNGDVNPCTTARFRQQTGDRVWLERKLGPFGIYTQPQPCAIVFLFYVLYFTFLCPVSSTLTFLLSSRTLCTLDSSSTLFTGPRRQI